MYKLCCKSYSIKNTAFTRGCLHGKRRYFMAKGDQLDIILGDPNLTWEDWETLGSIFELTKINQATKQEK